MRKYSVIITARNSEDSSTALKSLVELKYVSTGIEVITAIGKQPSLQRNEAAKVATGEYLLFIDNDSVVHPRLLQYYDDALSYESGIGIVGGPAHFRSTSKNFKAAIQAFFDSAFGMGPFRARYSSIGRVRASSERELILCNMVIRRDLFLAEGGFNLELYPNEENEFLNRVQHQTKIYYHPLAICYREPEKNIFLFAKQILNYGAGRSKHLLLFPQFWNHIFLLPLVFFLYCLGLLTFATEFSTMSGYLFLPIFLYLVFSIAASAFACLTKKNSRLLILLPPVLLLGHFFYGMGFLIGSIRYLFPKIRNATQVEISLLKSFEKDW